MRTTPPRILLAVTSDRSLALLRGFPSYLVAQGWDVHVVSSPGPMLDQVGALEGISVHPIRMAREPSPFGDLLALARWIKLLRALQPDVLSAGTPKAGFLGMVAGRLVRVPHRVYQLRGLRLETTRGLWRWILTLTERMAAASAHRVLSVSDSLMSLALELRIVGPEKILVLGAGSSNGVDAQEFEPSNFAASEIRQLRGDLGLLEGVPVIGFVGRFSPDKGLATLLGAREFLATKGVDHQLLVVGGHLDVSAEKRDQAPPSSVRAGISTGHVSNAAIYYQLMDVLCLPTLREGFPNVVLEAAASRVPTVTTLATGARDSVRHGETGFLVSVGSAAELGSRLQELLDNPHLRRAMGEEARRVVGEFFDRDRVWELSEEFYRGLIGAQGQTLVERA